MQKMESWSCYLAILHLVQNVLLKTGENHDIFFIGQHQHPPIQCPLQQRKNSHYGKSSVIKAS